MAPGKEDVLVICPAQRMTEVKIQSEHQTPKYKSLEIGKMWLEKGKKRMGEISPEQNNKEYKTIRHKNTLR